ncbi:RNA polymerase sigma factor [Rufibacter glacialis]|uniref:RNA polymerase sigma factor n=1 Tax=Rufibacter glacialis TaxID=1259555 RepID=A0A5M8Q774_9BACT|nr:RNA polymerase sigma factor [Rufibacter glacialis]KAA6431749.1 RNA polymerase sigma factor [Rufibacter glacialis]GGK81926.1 RNA polymerase sigma factor [Rufibacter glacialis]
MNEATDEQILFLFQNPGTKDKGFTLLMDRYNRRIYWHIRRLVVAHEDAQDLLQETFINVYKHLHTFNGDSKLYTWLYRVATNECLRLFKERKRFLGSFEEISEKLVDTLHENSTLESDQVLVRLQEAILRLPEKQRLVFTLRYYDELPYEEISKILDSSVSSLKTNYHLASSKVKAFMIKEA